MRFLKRLRYFFRLVAAFLQQQRRLIILGAVIGGLVFYFGPKLAFFTSAKNTRKIGLVGRFSPNELPLEIQNLISGGLTKLEPDGRVVPFLAKSWETNNEGREYLFTLKDDLFWQDETPLVAVEVNYNFSDVTTIPLDETNIKFLLQEPFSPFPSILTLPIFKKRLLGVGDYRLKTLSRQGEAVEKIVLSAKDKSLPKLVYQFYPSEETARTAFKLGEVNSIQKLTSPGELGEWPGLTIKKQIEKSRYTAIFFNTQDEYLSEKSLRQALAYAIKKPWESRALSPLKPDTWAYNPGVKPYYYDIDNAQKLLAGSQEEREAPLTKIELATVPTLLSVAEEIASDWRELGIEVEVKIINFIPEDFQALLVTQEIPNDPDQYALWHSTQNTNLSRYKNPKIDKLLEDGRQTLDLETRKEIYYDFQRFIVEDTPAIFLYHPILYTIERK